MAIVALSLLIGATLLTRGSQGQTSYVLLDGQRPEGVFCDSGFLDPFIVAAKRPRMIGQTSTMVWYKTDAPSTRPYVNMLSGVPLTTPDPNSIVGTGPNGICGYYYANMGSLSTTGCASGVVVNFGAVVANIVINGINTAVNPGDCALFGTIGTVPTNCYAFCLKSPLSVQTTWVIRRVPSIPNGNSQTNYSADLYSPVLTLPTFGASNELCGVVSTWAKGFNSILWFQNEFNPQLTSPTGRKRRTAERVKRGLKEWYATGKRWYVQGTKWLQTTVLPALEWGVEFIKNLDQNRKRRDIDEGLNSDLIQPGSRNVERITEYTKDIWNTPGSIGLDVLFDEATTWPQNGALVQLDYTNLDTTPNPSVSFTAEIGPTQIGIDFGDFLSTDDGVAVGNEGAVVYSINDKLDQVCMSSAFACVQPNGIKTTLVGCQNLGNPVCLKLNESAESFSHIARVEGVPSDIVNTAVRQIFALDSAGLLDATGGSEKGISLSVKLSVASMVVGVSVGILTIVIMAWMAKGGCNSVGNGLS